MMFQGEILGPRNKELPKHTDKQSSSNELSLGIVSAPSLEAIKSSWGVIVTHL